MCQQMSATGAPYEAESNPTECNWPSGFVHYMINCLWSLGISKAPVELLYVMKWIVDLKILR